METGKKNIKLKKENIALGVFIGAIIIGVCTIFYFANKKQGFFCDEVYSYGLANSVDYTFLDTDAAAIYSDDTWVDGEFFKNYVTVDKYEIFSFAHIWRNQAEDVLPPFYYLLLHIFSCFSLNHFTKWTGIVMNLVCYVVAMVYLYKLSRLFTKREYAFFPCALWGISVAGINTVLYIRMYCLLSAIVLMFLYVFIKTVLAGDNPGRSQWIQMGILIALGVLTHYYFIVFIALLGFAYFIHLLIKKNYKLIGKYAVMLGLDVVAVSAVFPYMYKHLFFSYRSRQAFSQIKGGFFEGILGQFNNINNTYMGGIAVLVLIIAAVLFVSGIVKCQKNKSFTYTNLVVVLLVPAVTAYIIIISKVAPYHDEMGNRYIYIMYPLISFLLLFVFERIPEKIRAFAMILMVAWIGFTTIKSENISCTYYEDAQRIKIAKENSDKACFYVYDTEVWLDAYSQIQTLMQYKNVQFIAQGNIEQIPWKLDERNLKSDELIVLCSYSFTDEECEQICSDINEMLGYEGYQFLFSNSTTRTYKLYDNDENLCRNRDVYYQDEDAWKRFDDNGNYITGEQYMSDGWFYFDESGAMQKGPVRLDDGRCVFYDTISGKMLTGAHVINGNKYYFDIYDGHLKKGSKDIQLEIDGRMYEYKDWNITAIK